MAKLCDECGVNISMHSEGDKRLCCSCYIEGGGIPADWHIECMKQYKIKEENNGKILC